MSVGVDEGRRDRIAYLREFCSFGGGGMPEELRAGQRETFLEQARWRDEKAREYPDDRRNADSAAALRELADRALALPDDLPALRDIADLCWSGGEFMFGTGASRDISRIGGFDGGGSDLEYYLDHLADIVVGDAEEEYRMAGIIPSDGDSDDDDA